MIRIPEHIMYSITEAGEIYSHYVNRFIRQTIRTYNNSGYRRVGLLVSSSPKRYKYYYTHQLVMLTYVGIKPKGTEIDHRDRNTGNNHISNLRYVTPVENCKNRNTYKGGPIKSKRKLV